MTAIAPGSNSLFFNSKEQIVSYVLKRVLSNRNKLIGTEWEFFFVTTDGHPISRENGRTALVEFQKVFSSLGYNASFIHEHTDTTNATLTGVAIPGIGNIFTEAGFQFEFACDAVSTAEAIYKNNTIVHTAILHVTRNINHEAIFKGYLDGYGSKAEGIDKSRSNMWREYYRKRFPSNANTLLEAQQGTACTQVTLDSGANDFHEYFKTLLLIEPILSYHYSNSERAYVNVGTYGKLIPSQVLPIANAWAAQTPHETVSKIVDALLEIDVPFIPDPQNDHIYKPTSLTNNKPPRVMDLMNAGKLSEKALNNVASFMYTWPALKNFTKGLLEVRGIDSQTSPAMVTEIAERVQRLIYNDKIRKSILRDYSLFGPLDILNLHMISCIKDKSKAPNIIIAGMTFSEIVSDIIGRSQADNSITSISEMPFISLTATA